MARPNARFWVYVNGGPVRLTLKPGQQLQHHTWERHEEGWSSEATSWEYPDDEDAVYREWCLDGRDCDGRLTRHGADRCDVANLSDGVEIDNEFYEDHHYWTGKFWPAWDQHEPGMTYDEFAQASGY